MVRAPFIVFEGPEGAGKSIQASRLRDWLIDQGWTVVLTREPGGTPVGDEIRHILLQSEHLDIRPETEVLLLAAGRAQHVRELIVPALDRGEIVICDRYVDSTLAYQGGGHELPLDAIRDVQQYATGGLVPDLRILLDVPVEIGLARRHADASSVNRIDKAPVAFHRRVRDMFLHLAGEHPDGWAIVDASQDVDAVTRSVHTVVGTRVLAHASPPGESLTDA